MPRMTVDTLEPGMKLARPIMNSAGMVLVAEGTELTEAWIERIRDMDIESVVIDGPSQPSRPKEDVLAELDRRFAPVAGKPHMGLLKKAVKEHIEALYE